MAAPAASMTRSACKLPAPTKVMRSPSTATAERPGRDQTWPLTIARDAATERQCSRMARLETGTARAAPLADWIGAIPSEIAAAGYDLDTMRLIEHRDYDIACNWKVYVDNYLEGYHLPIAHPGLFKELEYDNYRVETFRYYSKQHAPIRKLKPDEVPGRDRRYIRMPGAEDNALYYWIFPNTMLNIYQDNVSTNVILPMGPGRTLTIFEWFFAEPGTGAGWESMQQTIAFSDEIQQEDIAVCEQVQRGLRSRSYSRGRFSALRENGVHHFQSLVREFLDRP